MTTEEIKKLLERYNNGECTEQERAIIEETFMEFNEGKSDLSQKKIAEISKEIRKNLPGPDQKKMVIIKEEVPHSTHIQNNETKVKIIKAIAAVMAFFFVTYGNYKYMTRNRVPIEEVAADAIKPGSNKATLTLGNGKKINLSDAKTGVIIDINELIYSDGTPIENIDEPTGSQTLTTPKGGQYQLIFKDGTKIWLNAASTLTFKTCTTCPVTREVSLNGEAYFEIAVNKERPFKVHSNGQVIEVLGTHFNVTAYKDQSGTITTLLEGSVKVNESTILKPGEQSILSDSKISLRKVDTDYAIAWKNGEFMFFREPLKHIMPIIARWYDVEISYQNPELANRRFSGTISKFENAADVLNMLELTGEINFKIEGRRILVMP